MVFLAQVAQTAGTGSAPSPLVSFMPIILIFVVFYFLLIRPQQKKQAEHKNVISQLKKNDEVVTSGGIHGTIVNVKDDSITLRLDENVRVEFQKGAVMHVKKKQKES